MIDNENDYGDLAQEGDMEMKRPHLRPDNTQAPAPQQQPWGLFIAIEAADGGAIMVMQSPAGKRNAVISGDPESAMFQRKVQKIAVNWTKEFFFAPPRQVKVKEEEEVPQA